MYLSKDWQAKRQRVIVNTQNGSQMLALCFLARRCETCRQIENTCVNYFRSLEATKVTGNGHNYFVPNHSMVKVDAFESFIDGLNEINQNSEITLTVNSFYVIDDAKQRKKMTEEFYSAVKKEITE